MTAEEEVIKVVIETYEAIKKRDLEKLISLHSENGYSRFSDLPPYDLTGFEEAIKVKQGLMTQLADFDYQLKILSVKVIDRVAIVTYEVSYGGMLVYNYRFEGRLFNVRSRCTSVLVKEGSEWKLLHEHSSRIPE